MTDLWKLPASALAALVHSRVVSAREVMQAVLARHEAVHPAINAIVDAMPERALKEADEVDRLLAASAAVGPLAGVPVTIKTTTDTQGTPTTFGLRIKRDNIAAEDSPLVSNVRKAGAIVFGKTTSPAFAIRWFTRNSLDGATLNPHDRSLTPGGSSGGASAAVAAGVGPIAHGTDIAGSIRYPAYACNVQGLRPSLGRVPAVNFSGPNRTMGGQLAAVSGPLARSIGDLRLALHAMAAPDLRDPWWVPAPLTGTDYPRKAALSISPEGLNTDPAVGSALREAASSLAAAGWQVEEMEPPSFRHAARINMALWLTECRHATFPYVDDEDDPDARVVVAQLERMGEGGPDAVQAMQERLGLLQEWRAFLADWPVLICPVSAEPPFPDHLDLEGDVAFDRVFEAQLTQVGLPALGLPALSVATGKPGAPMGVQLVANSFREDVLFDAGTVIEAAHPPIDPVEPFVSD